MVALFRPMILAAVAFYGSAQGQPASKADRQMNIDVSPVADYVVVDPIGEYMRSTTLGDGTIIGGYVALDGTDANLRVVRSGDGGDSWEQIATVDGGPIAEKEINNAFPLVLADGRILYAFRNHDKFPEGGFSIYRITLYESKDSGVTWSFLSQIDERIPDGLNGLWEPFLRETGDGTIQAYYSAENSDTDQDNLMRASTDGGATWGDIINVSGGDVESRDGMTGVTAIDDGTLICVFENTETGPYSINAVFSTDDGYTWGSRTRVHTAADDHQLGAPQVINVGGTLVVSFMSDEAGNGPGADNGEMRVVTSTDGAATWSEATVVSSLGSHWPGLHLLDDSNFLIMYSHNDVGLVTQKHAL